MLYFLYCHLLIQEESTEHAPEAGACFFFFLFLFYSAVVVGGSSHRLIIKLGRGGTRVSKSRADSQLVHSKCKRLLLNVTAASSKVRRGEDRARYTGAFIQYVKGTGWHERGLHWDLSLPGQGPCHTITKKPSINTWHPLIHSSSFVTVSGRATQSLPPHPPLGSMAGNYSVFFFPPSLSTSPFHLLTFPLSPQSPGEACTSVLILKYATKNPSAPCLLSTPCTY